jgi:hypothetical protein
MTNERILEDVALHNEWLNIAIRDNQTGEYDVEASVAMIGFFLAGSVVHLDWLSLDDLRRGVSLTNALDSQAVELLEIADEVGEADRTEALARRIIHHSSRNALRHVKSKRRRQIFRMRFSEENVLSGMGAVEMKDLYSSDDFADER